VSNSQQISGVAVALVRFYYGDGTKYLTVASGIIGPEWTEEEYRPLLITPPVDASKVDMFTSKFSTGEIKLKVSNGDYHPDVKFSDFVNDLSLGAGNDIGFENRACVIKKWTPGKTTWDECDAFRDGKVRDIAQTDSVVTFSIQDRREIIHTDIGTFLTSAEAANPAQQLPAASQGAIGPIIYGSHQYFVNNSDPALATVNRSSTMPYAVDLGYGDRVQKWKLSKHKLNNIERIWAFESATARPVALFASANVSNDNTDGAVQSHGPWYDEVKASGLTVDDFVYPNGVDDFPGEGWEDTENAIDSDFDTFANALTASIISGLDASNPWEYPFNEWDNPVPDLNIIGIADYVRSYYSLDAGTITDTFTIGGHNLKDHGAPSDIVIAGGPAATRAGVEEDVTIDYGVTVQAGAATTVRIYEFYKRILYLPLSALPLMTSCIGREYTSTNGLHSAGDPIHNPVGGIESLYVDELAQTSIDQTAFNAAETARASWEFAFSIVKLTKSLKLIQEMAQNSGCVVHLKPDNTISIEAIAGTYTSSDLVIDYKDIIGKPRFTRTNPKNLYTAVNVRYRQESTTGKFTFETGIAEDTAMQAKYNITQQESLLTFESKFINDSATAILLRTFLLNQWKQLHNIITFEVGAKYLDDMDIGKIIEFDNVPSNIKAFGLDITQNNTIAGQIVYKYWFVTGIKKGINSATITAFELHDLS